MTDEIARIDIEGLQNDGLENVRLENDGSIIKDLDIDGWKMTDGQ